MCEINGQIRSIDKLNSFNSARLARVGFLFALFLHANANAAPNTFQVGSGTIHDTFANNTYDTFNLAPPFVDTPAIFILGNTAGSNSCEVRLQNVGLTSFDAVCAEDSSWDGQHLAVPVQYAAITEGVKTIPTNNGGSVTFEVGCVDTNSVQHNCTTGCDTESYEDIMFSASFTNPPVVLANIQTTANATLGAPPVNSIEPILSVAVDNITSSGFDLALDLNKENNVGSLNDERICWLAVEETSRCDLGGTDDTLNFSSIGGPASVAFEAIITPDNIDGWDNGCNNTEEATFTPGCFTSTPVAIATKRGRQEPEGWLRYCTLNSGELRLTIDEQRVTGQNRQHVDETASVVAFGSSFTTPVTLSRFSSEQKGARRINFEWETESESFNIGFHLWAEIDGQWTQLNKRIIASDTDGLATARAYKKRLSLSKSDLENATAFGLSSVDNGGYEEFFGPFQLGKEYGQAASLKPIDWSAIRAEYSENMRAAGYVFDRKRWRRSTDKREHRVHNREYQIDREVVSMSVSDGGIHKVSFADVQNAGADFAEVPLEQIALTFKGQAVPRWISSQDDVFNQGDEVTFYAQELDKADAVYIQDAIYRLQRDATKVVNASIENVAPVNADQVSDHYMQPYTEGENKLYVATSTSGDPWMDRKIFALGGVAKTSYSFDVTRTTLEADSNLTVSLLGGIDFPSIAEQNPDHHVVVQVNGTVVADVRFDGFKDQLVDVTIPSGTVSAGQNIVEIILPGDTGQLADIVYVDQVLLKVPHTSELLGDTLRISAQQNDDHLRVTNAVGNVEVFAYQSSGNFAVLVGAQLEQDALLFRALNGVSNTDTSYEIVTPSGFMSPSSLALERPTNLTENLDADYLIIAHPTFINDDLERFARAKQDVGYKTKIVDWLEIVETYGFGMATPSALRSFLKDSAQKTDFSHVLLVGGHSYDYNDHLNLGNVNFIPTMYQTVAKNFVYAPTDALLVDTDDDGLPNAAVGRWPVRTASDLRNIANKTIRWEADSAAYAANSLFIADVTDSARGQNFADQLNDLATAAGLDLEQTNVSQIYLDDYLERSTETPIEEAKEDLLDQFSQGAPGVGMTIYNGHSSSSRWTFRNLLNASDVVNFDNDLAPTFILPLACYTTLYESPSVDTLAHQLLFGSEGGAVALSGAAYLSEYRENAEFAKRLLKNINKSGASVGQAILAEKAKMMPWNDMVTNWSYLGDPSLKFASAD